MRKARPIEVVVGVLLHSSGRLSEVEWEYARLSFKERQLITAEEFAAVKAAYGPEKRKRE